MKKFAKMSLVAAVAVAGFTSTVSAKDLSEAIKGVDISGTVVYRYDDRKSDDAGKTVDNGLNKGSNGYKAIVNIKSPINDDLALNASVVTGINNSGDIVYLDTTTTGDANPNLQLSKVNFVYTGISHTTAIVGKQGLTTPWTMASDADGNEQTGTGILALVNAGPATIAGAYFNQTNLNASGDFKAYFDGNEDIATIGVMANIGPVALDAWYLSLMGGNTNVTTDATAVPASTVVNVDNSFDSYTVGAKYSVKVSGATIGAFARYSNLEFDKDLSGAVAALTKKNSFWKLGVTAKMGIFGGMIGYGQTDKDGGIVALDNDAKTGFQGWTVQPNGVKDADILKANLNVQALKSLNIALNYNEVDATANDKDAEEIYLQGTWTPSKNFYTYVRFGQNTKSDTNGKDTDSTIGRLQVQYSF